MRFVSVAFAAFVLLMSLAFAGSYPAVAVEYNALSADTYRVASAPGDVACGASASQDWSYQNAKLIQIRAGEEMFTGGPVGNYNLNMIYIDPVGRTNNGATLNGIYDQNSAPSTWNPVMLWRLPGRDYYNWNYAHPESYVRIPALGTSERPGTLNFW